MRVAFYAPLKPPTHPVPSGDRRMARLLMAALARANHRVELASRFRSREGHGDPARQEALAAIGRRTAERLIRAYRARAPDARPELWFTYHLYYKAPDWLGPAVADALRIPYVVAEASHAGKRADGPWAIGHEAAAVAIARADAIVNLNPTDISGVMKVASETAIIVLLKPFLDGADFAAATARRDESRADLACRFALDPEKPWLLTVAMMREGDKLQSYRVLGDALARLDGTPWQLLVVGDGPARSAVEGALARLGAGRVRYAGARLPEELPPFYAAADLQVWPAINEAYGMTLLEAQAAGLPVVAGASGGVPAIVSSERTGLLVPPGDADAFAAAMRALIEDPERRRRMGSEALDTIAREHDIATAAGVLDRALRDTVTRRHRFG
ncbi:MAG TPA: glycosyltransferase family 4 protein [Dongiaceae bacterium]|jgi:glycosyltransferase involved in cell wall biosynthesis|nr:glycosyltransferase family 4 protein [Dongiaceae bacterium]